MKLFFKLKQSDGCLVSDLQKIHPPLIIVLGYFCRYCDENGLPCNLTNILSKFKVSKSTTHPDGRAFDASPRGWKKSDITKCIKFMNRHVGHLGAISSKDKKRRVAVYHNAGKGWHFHFQVAK